MGVPLRYKVCSSYKLENATLRRAEFAEPHGSAFLLCFHIDHSTKGGML